MNHGLYEGRAKRALRVRPRLMRIVFWAAAALVFFGGVGLFASCKKNTTNNAPENMQQNIKLRVLLDWTPNTNHLGVYVAQARGWFAEEGLAVSVNRAMEQSVEALVASGKAEFGFSYQEGATMARAAKSPVPIVALAAVIRHNTSGFAGLRESGIRTARDFEGKKYSAFGAADGIERFTLEDVMKPVGGDAQKVVFVPGGEIDFFQGIQSGLIDFAWIFAGWTGVEASLKGIDLFYIPLAELNPVFDYYTPIIISSEEFIAKSPQIVRAFMRAVKKGYEYAAANPREAAAALTDAEPGVDKELAFASAEFLADKFAGTSVGDSPRWGRMEAAVWENYTQWLKDKGIVPAEFSAAGAFTNEFLE